MTELTALRLLAAVAERLEVEIDSETELEGARAEAMERRAAQADRAPSRRCPPPGQGAPG